MRSSIVALLVLVVACGPKKGPDGGGGGGAGSATGSAGAGDGSAGDGDGDGSATGGGGGGDTAAPLTRAECERMIDHVLAIGMEEQRKQKPAEYVPTEQQVAEIRASLVEQQLAPCLEWPRPVWECTMTATSVASLYACAEAP